MKKRKIKLKKLQKPNSNKKEKSDVTPKKENKKEEKPPADKNKNKTAVNPNGEKRDKQKGEKRKEKT